MSILQDQRYANAYVFGAVCAERDAGAAIVMPRANTEATQKHLEEISANVAPGAYAVVAVSVGQERPTIARIP